MAQGRRISDYLIVLTELAVISLEFEPTIELIGPAPDAMRFHSALRSGSIRGAAFEAHALGRGGEWSSIRGDGYVLTQAQCILEARPGCFIFVDYSGTSYVGEDGYVALLEGHRLTKTRVDISLHFHASAGDLRWLNRTQCFGSGCRDYDKSTFTLPLYHFSHTSFDGAE